MKFARPCVICATALSFGRRTDTNYMRHTAWGVRNPTPRLYVDRRLKERQQMDRAIIRVSGEDPAGFLQGLVSNDTRRLAKDGIVYAAMLTPQGKYLADFFLVADGADVLIDVAAPLADDLFKRLSMYKLRAPVTLVREDMPVSRGTGPVPAGALRD